VATACLLGTELIADDRYGSPPADEASEILILYRRDEDGAPQQPSSSPSTAPSESKPASSLPPVSPPPTATLSPVEPEGTTTANPLRSPVTSVSLPAQDDPPTAALVDYDTEQEPPTAPLTAEAKPLVVRESVISGTRGDVIPAAELKNVNTSSRRLAPPSRAWEEAATSPSSPPASRSRPHSLVDMFSSQAGSFKTAGTGLAIVIGLFVVCMWLFKPAKRKASGVLPTEAFEVLGRAPLVGQSVAHLLRLGNKLILVTITPDGAQTLAEVTDPMEVGRLAGLCAGTKSNSPTAEFQQVFAQLSREPARGFLGREAASGRRKA
jgi:flagellar biogenesis protein FliO